MRGRIIFLEYVIDILSKLRLLDQIFYMIKSKK